MFKEGRKNHLSRDILVLLRVERKCHVSTFILLLCRNVSFPFVYLTFFVPLFSAIIIKTVLQGWFCGYVKSTTYLFWCRFPADCAIQDQKLGALVLSVEVSKELLMLSASFVITHCLELVHIRSMETIVNVKTW